MCSYVYLVLYFVFSSMLYLLFFFFFFSSRRRHTRLQGDWSSDVCSSDLGTWFLTGIIARSAGSACPASGSFRSSWSRLRRWWTCFFLLRFLSARGAP